MSARTTTATATTTTTTTTTTTPRPPSTTPFLRSLSSRSLLVPSKDKPRLYIVLYPRGGSSPTSSFRNNLNCDAYHWSIVVGPQTSGRKDQGTRYHVAHLDQESEKYIYEDQDIASNPSLQNGLIRVTVAKVTDEPRLQSIIRAIQIREDDTAFNCLTWVREVFLKLHQDDWNAVEACARKYCKRKRDIGRWQEDRVPRGLWNMEKISTFNFWENRETTA
ncbi:uncharacterized protein A1O9_05391 [Exophiala aquamarina CBS 119918]|uniref:Uncharacterized protein n=1 Tax=Exophiala aquamarina CBS 119918 TaxID=1182545 RepID=A0A072PBJ1_9EURO|nr:uncharacterized protein A1O9_05391 [Exophiala aquamarina CBS 119918]KEF57474.1 hypothetical protein A1O9_05391 [Exophiala aquamarina CBS 119918]